MGSAQVIRSVLGVLDHFDLALNQDHTRIDVEQLVGGVRIVRDELLKALQTHGVERVEPAVGDEFDPNRHEAMMRQPSDDAAPNTIVSVLSPGYTMGDLVLRPAKVAVAAAEES
ncbi:MAG: nucleotide exchange factor GrpE [Planctomycetes bacterium]|nr:nucleotide exchange factor GrpE [Planctomycetota bacterium]